MCIRDRSLVALQVVFIAISGHAIFSPGSDGLFAISLILFLFASLVPTPAILFGSVCIFTLIAYPSVFILAANSIPEVGGFWGQKEGSNQLLSEVMFNSASLSVLCCTTVFVNYSLYTLRRRIGKLEQMGNYQVKTVLGEGGMGVVYEAEHTLLKRPAAVKVLKIEDGDSAEAILRFEREVKLSSMLSHPNTITVFDYGQTPDNRFFYAMELLEGLDLQEFSDDFGPMSAERITFLFRQVCASLNDCLLYTSPSPRDS